jgi:hypothetical protein
MTQEPFGLITGTLILIIFAALFCWILNLESRINRLEHGRATETPDPSPTSEPKP